MVESERDAITGGQRIILSPNASLNERQAAVFLATAALIMGGIAVGFASLGLWLVLPFSGAEWVLLAVCLRASFRNSAIREVISIDDATVVLEQGRGGPERTYRFQRAWMSLELAPPAIRGHPRRLFFRLHGRRVEVGRFLAETERDALVHELQQLLADKKIRYHNHLQD